MKHSNTFNIFKEKNHLNELFHYDIVHRNNLTSIEYINSSELIKKITNYYNIIDNIDVKKDYLLYLSDNNKILKIKKTEQKYILKKISKSNFISIGQNKSLLRAMTSNYLELKKWLKEKNSFLTPNNPLAKEVKTKPNFSLRQIALIYIYQEKQITRKNGDQIARKYLHNSGEKLFHHFTYYSSQANRKGRTSPFTKKKMENKIKLFEKVANHPSINENKKALDELNILRIIYKNELE
jgi:hypothetical protein